MICLERIFVTLHAKEKPETWSGKITMTLSLITIMVARKTESSAETLKLTCIEVDRHCHIVQLMNTLGTLSVMDARLHQDSPWLSH